MENIDVNKLIKYIFDNYNVFAISLNGGLLKFLRSAINDQSIDYKDEKFIKYNYKKVLGFEEGEVLFTNDCIFLSDKVYNDRVTYHYALKLNQENKCYKMIFIFDDIHYFSNDDILGKADDNQKKLFFNCLNFLEVIYDLENKKFKPLEEIKKIINAKAKKVDIDIYEIIINALTLQIENEK